MPLSYGISLTRPDLEGPTSALTANKPTATNVAQAANRKIGRTACSMAMSTRKCALFGRSAHFVNLVTKWDLKTTRLPGSACNAHGIGGPESGQAADPGPKKGVRQSIPAVGSRMAGSRYDDARCRTSMLVAAYPLPARKHAMLLDLTQTLADLVALPSVNPMGRTVDGPEFYEYRVTDYLEQLFRRLELPYARQTVEPKRDNIVARLDGQVPPERGGPLVLFEAHQDTVPVVGMTIEPWTPAVRDGRMYGRGACDIKGGMAAMLGAVARLADERPKDMPTIVMACTVNEEHGYSGATALTKLWTQGGPIVPRQPDAAIVAEPTELQVVVAHKGVVRWRCQTHGRATHSSQPHLGVNAIFKMRRVLEALERYQRGRRADPGPAPAVRQADVERRHDQRRAERQHRARHLHDRNRSPLAAGRKARAGLPPGRRLRQRSDRP